MASALPMPLIPLQLSRWGIASLVWQGLLLIASLSVLFGAPSNVTDASIVMFSFAALGTLAYLGFLLLLRFHRSKFMELDRTVRDSFHSDQWIASVGLGANVILLICVMGLWIGGTSNAGQVEAILAICGPILAILVVSLQVGRPAPYTVRATGELVAPNTPFTTPAASQDGNLLAGLSNSHKVVGHGFNARSLRQ